MSDNENTISRLAYYERFGEQLILVSEEGKPIAQYKTVAIIWHPEHGIITHGGANGVIEYFNQIDTSEEIKLVFFEHYDSVLLLNSLIHNVQCAQFLYDNKQFQMMKVSGMN